MPGLLYLISKTPFVPALGQVDEQFGNYLGAPLVHGRVLKSSYNYVIQKSRKKLASWKMRSLSKAARTLLIRTTLSAISLDIMQSALLPIGVVMELTKLCRRFF